jgi:hypothetical protein
MTTAKLKIGTKHWKTVAQKTQAENIRLRTAIQWALGEAPDEDGKWFGEVMPEQKDGERLPPWWWRKPLRRIAGLGNLVYDKTRRTIVDQQQGDYK